MLNDTVAVEAVFYRCEPYANSTVRGREGKVMLAAMQAAGDAVATDAGGSGFLLGLITGLLVGLVAAVAGLAALGGPRFRLALRVLLEPALAAQLDAPPPPPPEPPAPPKPSGAPLRLLALLQREGRLLDFLLEDVSKYNDAQIGAAVRDIHRKCAAALKEHLTLEPVLPQKEGDKVTVPAGFDPSAIRLTGPVLGSPPFAGTLQHHGWRVSELKLAAPASGQDEFVVMPAEVEVAGAPGA